VQFYVGKKRHKKTPQNEHQIELDGACLVSPPSNTTKLEDGSCMSIKPELGALSWEFQA